MVIGLATEENLPALADIFNPYLGVGCLVLQPRTGEDYRELLEHPRSLILVGKDENETALGYASVKPWSERAGYRLAGEVSIFIADTATGHGLGSRLYTELFERAYALGYRYLAARIMGENAGSRRFHLRHGFTLVGVQRGIGMVDGVRKDTVLMEKDLTTDSDGFPRI